MTPPPFLSFPVVFVIYFKGQDRLGLEPLTATQLARSHGPCAGGWASVYAVDLSPDYQAFYFFALLFLPHVLK